jgi:hypothetical protein
MWKLAAKKQQCGLTGAENESCDRETENLFSSLLKYHLPERPEWHLYDTKFDDYLLSSQDRKVAGWNTPATEGTEL